MKKPQFLCLPWSNSSSSKKNENDSSRSGGICLKNLQLRSRDNFHNISVFKETWIMMEIFVMSLSPISFGLIVIVEYNKKISVELMSNKKKTLKYQETLVSHQPKYANTIVLTNKSCYWLSTYCYIWNIIFLMEFYESSSNLIFQLMTPEILLSH